MISRSCWVMILLANVIYRPMPGHAEVGWPDISTPARWIGGGEHDAAVVVGIESYPFVPSVTGAESNANAWYDYLTKTRGAPPGSVRLLLNNDAAREDMLGATRKVAAKIGPDGTLWFVFIGHGAPSLDGKDGLLVGVDAQQKAESLQTRSVRSGELLKELRVSRAGKIVVVLDACFSGRAQDGSSIVPGLQPLVVRVSAAEPTDPRMVVLTAAESDQFAGPLPGAPRPAFSYLVLGGLRGWASKDTITAGDLRRYASEALDATLRGRNQTPDLMGKDDEVVGVSAGEKGPDLAALAKATAGDGGIPVKNLAAVPAAEAPARSVATAPSSRPAPPTTTVVIGKAGIEWVSIPEGSFMMGSEDRLSAEPVHWVSVKAFQIAKYPVTNKQYKACMDAGACTTPHHYGVNFNGDDQPVVGVNWNQGKAFSEWVGGRLPTEAEWEYAARSAGKNYMYPWGNKTVTCERAVIDGCATATMPVCSKPAGNTEQGLCDMAGNVWQWMQDWYHDSYNGAPNDGSAWENPTGSYRVGRGGSWRSGVGALRIVYRDWYDPTVQRDRMGFRPVR